MKAITIKSFGSIDSFKHEEVEQPQVQNDEVLIKIKATAFNPIDYQMRQGATESKLLKSPILGRELSGEIMQVGQHVDEFVIGDKVSAYVGSLASNGTYTEYISVPARLVAKNPSTLSFEQATAIPMVGMTALQCFNRMAVPKEKTILVIGGAGGVGTILIKLLLANGNTKILTTAGSTESIEHLTSIGINRDNIIDYHKEDVLSALKRKHEGHSFEYIIDLVGGKMSEVCADLIEVFGTYVDVTFLVTDIAREKLFDKAATVINITNYAPASTQTEESLAYYGNSLKTLFDKIEQNIITPTAINVIGDLSIETVQKAHQLMENNQTKGKKLVMYVE